MGVGSGGGSGGGLSGCGSDIWWRRGGVTYATNHVKIDITEKLQALVGRGPERRILAARLGGEIRLDSQLSDVPHLLLQLQNAAPLATGSFHACVSSKKQGKEASLAFCPPDGETAIASYWFDFVRNQSRETLTVISPPVVYETHAG
eukprot:GHVT01032519.1.p1 GENE.GHVT01032519.1~~GHVT01032519.1.p1  ORF type:complete len:147 (+),score=17.26 GHVT01032519.1:514-954(+)